MEEKTITRQHRLMLQDRKVGSFTGILDVISFDLNEILLETEQGMLHIKGKDLHVNRLDLDKARWISTDRSMHSIIRRCRDEKVRSLESFSHHETGQRS